MKKKLLVVLLCLTFLLIFPGLAKAQFGSISGKVTDEETGFPIMGAHVWARADTTQPGGYGFGITDTLGLYVIDSLDAGEFLVSSSALGYEDENYPESVIVAAAENTPDIDFALTPAEATGSISGMVTDGETGLPLPMAHVCAYGSTHVEGDAWTDTAGYYLIQNLVAGQYIVGVHKNGYEDEVYPESVTVEEGQNIPDIDFALTPIGEYGSISGWVTDEQTALPLPMAHVWAYDSVARFGEDSWTDTAGYYLIQNLTAGQYAVGAHKSGYEIGFYPELVAVEEGQNTPDIDFALTPTGEYGSIIGWVGDEETGLPIIMAYLRAIGLDDEICGEAWSDTSGQYGILDLPPGIYRVVVSKDGYAPETYPDSVIVVAGQNTPHIDFSLTPIGEYGSISGRVTDEETGLPISMAYLLAIGLDNWCYAEAWSDTSGYYTIQYLCTGIYQVNVHVIGYIPESYPDSVMVLAGENTSDIDFALTSIYFGDVTGDGNINLTDAIYLANYCLKAGPAPEPLEAGEVNCDDEINLSDVIYLANYLLKGGPAPHHCGNYQF